MNRIYKTAVFILLLQFISISASLYADEKHDYYLRLKHGWQDIKLVYDQINKHYVEDVDPYPLIKSGINGMLKKLDPYSVFLEEDGERRLQMITTGKYGGLGMEIGLRNKKVTIIAPIDDSPAQRMGIQAGDIIEEIDGHPVQDWNINKVSKHLRGKIGTDVALTIRRPGIIEAIGLKLVRKEIVIKDVNYFGFIEPGIAYVSLNGFTDKAPKETAEAIKSLQEQGEIKNFILDLRGNPGGLLESAVRIVNIFVNKGELVVSTKGFREKSFNFTTQSNPLLPDVSLVVLVDGGSASASEIVAGALQDLDRAVIIGEATFGKGLVQKVYTIDKRRDVKLKLTTAKYFIPSGRCIQKKDYSRENGIILKDSSQIENAGGAEYFTKNKRPVYDKGGIYPDVSVNADSVSYETLQLIHKNMFFDFAVQYHQTHKEWEKNPVMNDSISAAFDSFLISRDFVYENPAAKDFKRLEKKLKKKQSEKIKILLAELQAEIKNVQIHASEENKEQIKKYLHLELMEKYFGSKSRFSLQFKTNEIILEAVKILRDADSYKEILAVN